MFTMKFAKANVFIFPPSVTLSGVTATSTLTAIGPGLATSTLVFDAYNTGQPFAAEGAVVLVSDTSSSSAAILNITLSYSQNGVDWYGDSINKAATSTIPFDLNNSLFYRMNGNATASTTNAAFQFQTPTRYTRIVFSDTDATSTIFAQVTPKRQLVQ